MWLAALTSFALVAALALVGAFGGSVANADTSSGVYNLTVTGIGTHNGDPVIENGQSASLSFEYNTNAKGKTVTLDFPTTDGANYAFNSVVDTGCTASNVPTGNDAISCMGYDSAAGELTVTFKDAASWPSGTQGGVFGVNFTVASVTGNHASDLSWTLDGTTTTVDIVVAEDTGNFVPTVNSYGKSVNPSTQSLNSYYGFSGGTVTQTTDPSSIDLTYTVTATLAAAGTTTIADTLDPGLTLDPAAPTCSIVYWDSEGLNKESPASCSSWTMSAQDADSFSGDIATTGPAIVTLTYIAHPDPTKIQNDLQAYAGTQGIKPGTYSHDYGNKATFDGGNSKSADTTFTWAKPGVNLGSNSKSAGTSPFTGCVAVSNDTVDASGCNNKTVSYTLTYWANLASAQVLTITDQLPAGMEYDGASVHATTTTWDTSTYTPTGPTAFTFSPDISGTADASTGQSFSGTVSLDALPTEITVTYDAKVTDVTALRTALQSSYNALGIAEGSFSAGLKNDATFSPVGQGSGSVSNTVTVSGTKTEGLSTSTFSKTVDWTSKTVTGAASGDLTAPVDVTYTLAANLAGVPSTATTNVVIADTLPLGMSWAGAPSIASGTTIVGVGGLTAASCSLSSTPTKAEVEAFGAASAAGAYCTSGSTLLVNIGHDTGTDVSILAPAQIDTSVSTTLSGVNVGSPQYPDNTKEYGFSNTAKFYYGATNPVSKGANSTLYVRPVPGSDGFHVTDAFNKTVAGGNEIHVDPGHSTTIDYTFTVGAGYGIDARSSTITDYINPTLFDLGTGLSNVTVSGKYDGQTLTAGDFVLAQDADGNLLISLSGDGQSVVDTHGTDKQWIVTISLTTVTFTGKVTETVYNKATLTGGNGQAKYWADVTTDATSFGNEYEVQKRIYDATAPVGDQWVSSVDSSLGAGGSLAGNPFVYKVAFLAHGNYGVNSATNPTEIVDTLPANVEFLGFIGASDVGSGTFEAAVDAHDMSDQTLGGNLTASFDSSTGPQGTVTIAVSPNFKRASGDSGQYAAYFAVKATSSDGAPIVNSITNGPSATIVPIKPGGGVPPTDPGSTTSSTTSTSPTTGTTTTSPTTSTTRPPSTATIVPSSATSPTRPVPPPNQPPVTTTVPAPDQCAALVETGFQPGETVTVRVTGPDGQYEMSAVADANGTVHLCVNADHPQTVTIEVLGENRHTVREVTIGVLGTEGSLPNTGFATLRYVGWALLLLATGGALVFGAKRRDRGARHV